jgi:hypothetical protein
LETAKHKGSTSQPYLPKFLLILGLCILLACEAFFGYRLQALSERQRQIKEDYSTQNNITFGLFSVDQWRDKLTIIVNHQIRDFKLTRKQQKQLQIEVEDILHSLISKAESMINKPQKSIGGKLKKLAFKTFVDTDKIHAQVPTFAKTIISKVNDPESKKRLGSIATSKVEQLGKQTFDSTQTEIMRLTSKMYKKYQVTDAKNFNIKVNADLAEIKKDTYNYAYAMMGAILIVLLLWWFLRNKSELHATLYILSLLFAFILLFVGITAAMIEVDARINVLDFRLLGEHVLFENQVLFFQSKSILDVVEILIKQPKLDSRLVGILLLIFSILFPILKLSSTGIHLLGNKKLAEHKVVKYFAFQSGKWSMADVMVIGIMMTYIGLNGLLESQLHNLNIKSDMLTTITTNNTALQPGYIIFVLFVLYGLVLSSILKYITPNNAD